jgi:ribonucleoside-diphosphate reductase alpha chain
MHDLERSEPFQLVHKAEPSDVQIAGGAFRRDDGLWVYRTIDPQALWDTIMRNTYNTGEPGVLFLDRINAENNLYYCEEIQAVNPCGEECLADYSCCCLGSIDLTRFVREPFTEQAAFATAPFAETVRTAIRMLDNVLDLTAWPLCEQQREAMSKRRVGLGFTGLGDSLLMLRLRYDNEPGREIATEIARLMRDEAYRASVELAKEKGPFPLFDADKYLASAFVQRLPEDIRGAIGEHGIRNSHMLSIAPTGTISLAFADNCSNGIEPAFSWYYNRKKRQLDGTYVDYQVADHAYRLYAALGHDSTNLPPYFVNALQISAKDHMRMQAAVQPYVDAGISKTVNVPADYPFAQFQSLYRDAWHAGLKGITTFRPNAIVGSLLSVPTKQSAQDLDQSEPDRKIHIVQTPEVALASLRWTQRPATPAGNPGVTYLINSPQHAFALFIGHVADGTLQPFEVWINGEEQPRGLAALAKNLSMDMRGYDREWLRIKLESLSRTAGTPFELAMPPDGHRIPVPGNVAAMARLIRYRCDELGLFDQATGKTPLVDAMFSRKEPKSGTEGTLAWTVDVNNPNTSDDFALFLKECVLPDGTARPYSVWLAGNYPRDFDGLAKSLSLDMRVLDPAWIGKKLRGLMNMPEPQGDFFARVPGQDRQALQPSTVGYIARLLIHRYHRLAILDDTGYPLKPLGMMQRPGEQTAETTPPESTVLAGKPCPECGHSALIHRDGCDFCTACGYTGSCG